MSKKNAVICALTLFLTSQASISAPDRTQLAVWANEAIVATYTFDYKNFVAEQKDIAKYFTSDGWITYSKALQASKLPDAVQKNLYSVSAVALAPPKLVTMDPTHWQASMPLLVVYKNPQYQQQQTLTIQLGFTLAPSGQGVRGFAITSLQSKVTKPPCQCAATEE